MRRAIGLFAVGCTVFAAAMAALDAPHRLVLREAEFGNTSSGFFFIEDVGNIEWTVHSPGALRVAVDGRFVFDRGVAAEQAVAGFPLALTGGMHVLEIAHDSTSTPSISWRAETEHISTPVSAAAFAPVPLSQGRWRLRAARPWVGLTAAAAWALWLMALAWWGITRTLPGPALVLNRPMRVLLTIAAPVMVAGIGWGWPVQSWAPDELWPSHVLAGLAQGFAGGWFDLYPPGHFYVLSLFYSPLLLLETAGWLFLDAAARDASLHLLSRFVTVSMALGIMVLLARLAEQLGGRGVGWPTALCATASLPFLFYTRLANLDVPYLFWFCLSLVWFQGAVTRPGVRNVVGFAAAGMAAVVTKDQAYGLYLLPAIWLGWRLLRVPGGATALAAGTATAAVVFVLGHNLIFNAAGFAQHLASITGGGSRNYRMVPATASGLVTLAGIVTAQVWWGLGVPGVVLCIAGVWFHRVRPWIPWWMWLFPCSYLVGFVAVVGYSYDRFLLPVVLVLGLVGGAGLHGLLMTERRRRLSRVLAACCVAWFIWRAASVNALQVLDGRYAVQDWLEANVPPGAVVASPWQVGYLPRLDMFQHHKLEASPAIILRATPAYLVVNVEFMNRYSDDTPQRRWLQWLETESPYQEVFRFKRDLWWTELAWWPTFTDRRESLFTNLDKANPEIVIFGRRAPGS